VCAGTEDMRKSQALAVDTLAATVDELCQTFGAWKTTRALMRAVWRHRQTVNQTNDLSNRMRRDIGLPEDLSLDARFSVWDIRF
jgi:hypothetical protein